MILEKHMQFNPRRATIPKENETGKNFFIKNHKIIFV